MVDVRLQKLAHNLVHYSVRVQKGDKVIVSAADTDYAIVNCLIKEIYQVGAYPFVVLSDSRVQRELLLGMTKELADKTVEYAKPRTEDAACIINIKGFANYYETSDVPQDKMELNSKYSRRPIVDIMLKKRWVGLNYPNPSFAQLMGMSSEAFEDYYFSVCNLDYGKMDRAMDALKNLMEKTDKVQIKGNGTDIQFSIKGIKAIKCSGQYNIPDGEVYTAPIKNSVNGTISYNIPSTYQGFGFDKIKLTFANGKIVEASANDISKINAIFDTDEGARYIGEFAIGVNPHITKACGDILFDEKIAGSLHFTPGQCYDDAYNGNSSAIHWDLVLVQRPEFGGGEIWFDDKLVRKDGLFVTKELLNLNPENLI